MNLKLEVIRINEDVIATSACERSYIGCYYGIDDTYYYDYVKRDGKLSERNEILVVNIPDGIIPIGNNCYYYHADENGGFIEWCPAGESDHTNVNSLNAHNIKYGG